MRTALVKRTLQLQRVKGEVEWGRHPSFFFFFSPFPPPPLRADAVSFRDKQATNGDNLSPLNPPPSPPLPVTGGRLGRGPQVGKGRLSSLCILFSLFLPLRCVRGARQLCDPPPLFFFFSPRVKVRKEGRVRFFSPPTELGQQSIFQGKKGRATFFLPPFFPPFPSWTGAVTKAVQGRGKDGRR